MTYLILLAAMLGLSLILSPDDDETASTLPDVTPPDVTPPDDEGLDLTGTSGPDNLLGSLLDDTIDGAGGDDSIDGSGGDDELYGATGIDVIRGGSGRDDIFGGVGRDDVYGGDDGDHLYGGLGDDYLDGGRGNDVIDGGADNDNLIGYLGSDTLFGGLGDDRLSGGAGSDRLEGGAGIDRLFGGAGDDTIVDANRPFAEGPNESVVDAGDGNDFIWVDSGSTITGGAGDDQIRVEVDLANDDVTDITDFNSAEDMLELVVQIGPGVSGGLSVVDFADGTGANVFFGDTLVARVSGGQGMSPDDIDLRTVLA